MQVQVIFANKEECIKRKVSQTTITEVPFEEPKDSDCSECLEELIMDFDANVMNYLEQKFDLEILAWRPIDEKTYNIRTNC